MITASDVHQFIKDNPGLTAYRIARKLKMWEGSAKIILRQLVESRKARMIKVPKFSHKVTIYEAV